MYVDNDIEQLFLACRDGDTDLASRILKRFPGIHERVYQAKCGGENFGYGRAAVPLGWTALGTAAVHDNLGCVETLLENGAAVDQANDHGWTAAHMAAQHGAVSCLKALISAGTDLNKCTGLRKTPMHLAATQGQLACLEMLLATGADIYGGPAHNTLTWYPIDCARRAYMSECVDLLERSFLPWTTTTLGSDSGNDNLARAPVYIRERALMAILSLQRAGGLPLELIIYNIFVHCVAYAKRC